MFKSNKSLRVKFFAVSLTVFFSMFFILPVFAEENYTGNIPSDENMMMSMSMLDSIDLPFDPNDYNFLIYVPYGVEDSIEAAMTILGISYDVRDPYNEVTPNDLATHDILIVGWNAYGNTSGLHSDDLAAGITGRIILTGHDLDYHTVNGPVAAETMLIQSIDYVLQGGGTGLITLGCTSGFPYIPDEWDIDVIANGTEDINEFTPEGLISGVYDGLEPTDMEGWGQAYHDIFTIGQESEFVSFETGGYGGGDIVTIARTSPAIPPGCENLSLYKTEDPNDGSCVYPSIEGYPDSYINYNICYSFGPSCDINDVNIVDFLPGYCDYNDSNPQGCYDPCTHTVRWNFGDLIDANESNCITLKVKVAEDVNQGETLTNTVKMYSGSTIIRTAQPVYTEICCETDTIYVDQDANEGGDGKSWQTAYTKLSYAILHTNLCTKKIWVADGTYKPTGQSNSSATFQMRDGINVYGHFAGIGTYETEICQRNLADNNNISVLTGDLDDDNQAESTYVVTVASSHIDGFTVEKSTNAGIYATNCSPTIANCTIKENDSYGIFFSSGTQANITNTFVTNNANEGIFGYQADINIDKCTISANTEYNLRVILCEDVNALDSVFSNATGSNGIGILAGRSNLTLNRCDISDNSGNGGYGIDFEIGTAVIQNCRIQRNSNYGIYNPYDSDSDVVLKRNIISDNGSAGIYSGGNCQIINNLIYSNDSNGIYTYGNCDCDLDIRNNTISKNIGYGIYRNYDPYYGPEPDVNSNIIYANTIGGLYGTYTNVHYNCLQSGDTGDSTNIIGQNPQFRNADTNDFHLTFNSPCKNTGSLNFTPDTTETDIDGENRKMLNRVDMGADEFCPYDLSPDGFVNFLDFIVFAKAWGTHTGQTDFNDRCDFYDDGATDYINYRDLEIFCDYWLTPADWQGIGGDGAYFAEAECPLEFGEGMMMSMPSQPESQSSMFSPQACPAGSSDSAESAMIEESVESIEEPFDVNETLDWLDNLWQTDESIRESMTESDWQEFLNAIKSSQ